MGAPLAILICSIGVAGLFFLDRDNSVRTSKALWLPVIWIWIVGSRPASAWLGVGGSGDNLAATLDGSPFDAGVFAALMVIGVVVLLYRKNRSAAFIAVNTAVIIYFLYCLLSVAWSPFHDVAFKRWIKAIGDVVMVLLLVTEDQPVAALRRLYSRVGFVLLPFSVALIRYTDMGRNYDPDGNPMNTGVTTNKNTLGLLVFAIALGALWNLRDLLRDKDIPNRKRRLVAQGALLTFGIALLEMAHCATAVFCFSLGSFLMIVTNLNAFQRRPRRVRALCLAVVLAGGLGMLFGGGATVSNSLGRGDGLSGRSYIWAAAIAAADNQIIGTGFESFWNANAARVNRTLRADGFVDLSNLVSAHDGYLEVYLDLGLVGLSLIVIILIGGFWHAGKAFEQDPRLGGLMLAYLTTGTFYNITEAGFRMLTVSWIFLLLGVISINGLAAGVFGRTARPILASPATNRGKVDSNRPKDERLQALRTA